MVNLPPDPNERRSRDRDLSFDEWVALLVVFLSVGTILWWGLSRGRVGNIPLLSQATDMLDEPIFETDSDDIFLDAEDPEGFLFQEPEADSTDERAEDRRARRSARVQPVRPRGDRPSVIPPVSVTPDPVTPAPVTPDGLGDTATTVPAPAPAPTMPAEAETPPPLDISDVPEDYWAYPFIRNLYDNGFLPDLPEGQFQPDAPVNRAEFAALLNRALVENGAATATTFTDVDETYWAQEAISQVVAARYMSGYPENEFRPDQPVPRYQVMLTLATGLELSIPGDPSVALQRFTDDLSGLPEWAQGKVAAAVTENITANHPNADALRPAETATRAEIAVMLHQALVNQGRLDPPPAEG
ncbi:MAG: S-layer homology domain-containing protein [Cyanobacteria bacterium J06638_20]